MEWMQRVKQSLAYVSAHFNCQRMVGEYRVQLYEPAHQAFVQASRDGFAQPRQRAQWSREVAEKWPRVAIVDYGVDQGDGLETAVMTGSAVKLRATVELAGLDTGGRARGGRGRARGRRRRIGGYAGPVAGAFGQRLEPMGPMGQKFCLEQNSPRLPRGGWDAPSESSPNHFDDPLNRPCNAPLKWAGESGNT